MILFFGDSITSGENNNFNGFVEKLNKKECVNLGVSGTCIGDYSLYPVGNNNFNELIIKEKDKIKDADIIFVEYGSNDISSVLLNYTNIKNCLIELVKAVDAISQINDNAKLYFVSLGENKKRFAKGQVNYLKNDYFKNIDDALFKDLNEEELYEKWLGDYNFFDFFVKKCIRNVINLPLLDDSEIDKDNIHPNDKGYAKISKFIEGVINEK